MSSSDESSDTGQLLSQFQAYRPTSSPNTLSTTNHGPQLPKRRGRPKKVVPVVNLVDSDDNQLIPSLDMRPSRQRSSPNPTQGSGSKRSRKRHATQRAASSSIEATPQPSASNPYRARRSKIQVENYYSNSNYSGYVSGLDDDEGEAQSQQLSSRSSRVLPPPPPPKARPKNRAIRIIYDSHGVQISRHLFSKLDDVPSLPDKVPYSPESVPSRYAERFRRDPKAHVLHVSFSDDEVGAMIGLLSPYGVDSYLSEMSPVDQVIHLVQRIHKDRERGLAKRISKTIRLQKVLTQNDFDSLTAYHQAPKPPREDVKIQIDSLYDEIFAGKAMGLKPHEYVATVAALSRRRKADLCAFIKDARLGNLATRPFYIKAIQEHIFPESYRNRQMTGLFSRQPCNGYGLRRSHTWKGASNDVINLAWSPDGLKFAVGAAAQCDEHNMQYNRSNNLILGDFTHNSIKELPDHRIPYPVANPNNSHLYMSVSAVQWFDDSLYTSSYDKTVKIWDVSSYTNANCVRTLRHDLKVQIMARSHQNPNLLATGTDSTLHLWHLSEFDETRIDLDFLGRRAIKNPRIARDIDLLPASLAWSSSATMQNLLVAGFAGKGAHDSDACRKGLLAMWKMSESSIVSIPLQPNAQNIFDVKFHHTMPWVATGSSVPSMGTNGTGRDVRSLVRIYEPLTQIRCAIEFDCSALDMNDVSFCPHDRFYISASCTDGVTYVWDHRNPSRTLHQLAHGDALNQLDERLTREQADVGVRVALWGDTIDNFITGGSDGVLRRWNILRAPEDVHVQDIVTIDDEIMSGAFSPDKSTLLIGDAAGGIHVLQPDTDTHSESVEEFKFDHGDISLKKSEAAPSDSGREIARMLLRTSQLIQHPRYGIGQGPAYQGPYAAWARPEGTPGDQIASTPLVEEIQALQLDPPNPILQKPGTMASQVTVDMQRKVAGIRNRDPSIRKRKHHVEHGSTPTTKHRFMDIIDLCSDDEQSKGPVWIDLTSEPDDETSSVDMDSDAEDYWFPESCNVDPNIRDSE